MLLPASMDFLSRSDAESLRLAIAAVPPPLGRVTQDGLVAENQIHGPQSIPNLRGASQRSAEGGGWFGNLCAAKRWFDWRRKELGKPISGRESMDFILLFVVRFSLPSCRRRRLR